MVPLLALSGVLLIGATALAVDLSLQTNNRRNLQNVTDASTLAGARDLYSSGATLGSTDQFNAVFNALATIVTNMQWTTLPNNWAQTQISGGVGCTSRTSVCDVTVSNLAINGSTFNITVNTPPTSGAHSGDTHFISVEMHQTSNDFFGGVIGHTKDTQGSTSTAFHFPAQIPFGFALFSNTVVASGNQAEIVKGPVYANRYIQPQSGGLAAFCANPSAPGADDGYIIFGSPQSGDTGWTAADPGQILTPQDHTNDVPVQWFANCDATNTSGGVVNDTGTGVKPTNAVKTCPTVSGTQTTITYNTAVAACDASPAIGPPAEDPPPKPWMTVAAASGNNRGNTWSSVPATPGVYEVQHNPNCQASSNCYDLAISPTNRTGPFVLAGFTFVLDTDASIQFNGGLRVGPASTLTPFDGLSGLPTDGKYAIYAPSGSPFVSIDNQDGDGSNTLEITHGSVYIPTGTVKETNNGSLQILAGQAIANNWDVTSGNHPNPEITFSLGQVPPAHEFLGLVQ